MGWGGGASRNQEENEKEALRWKERGGKNRTQRTSETNKKDEGMSKAKE